MGALTLPLAGPLGGDPEDVDALDAPNNISKFLVAVCAAAVQPLEDCLQQLLLQRALDTAIGAQLDVIGDLVGEPRNGLDDDDFRRFCRAAIATHRSRGTTEDLLRILDLVIFNSSAQYVVQFAGTGTVSIDVDNIEVSHSLAAIATSFMARSVSAAVRVVVRTGATPPAGWFRFDSGPGFDTGVLRSAHDNAIGD